MQCPYCQKEMKEGFIYSGKSDICWTPKDSQKSMIINHPHENQIMLAKLHYLKGCQIKVFRCLHCQIEIIDENDL